MDTLEKLRRQKLPPEQRILNRQGELAPAFHGITSITYRSADGREAQFNRTHPNNRFERVGITEGHEPAEQQVRAMMGDLEPDELADDRVQVFLQQDGQTLSLGLRYPSQSEDAPPNYHYMSIAFSQEHALSLLRQNLTNPQEAILTLSLLEATRANHPFHQSRMMNSQPRYSAIDKQLLNNARVTAEPVIHQDTPPPPLPEVQQSHTIKPINFDDLNFIAQQLQTNSPREVDERIMEIQDPNLITAYQNAFTEIHSPSELRTLLLRQHVPDHVIQGELYGLEEEWQRAQQDMQNPTIKVVFYLYKNVVHAKRFILPGEASQPETSPAPFTLHPGDSIISPSGTYYTVQTIGDVDNFGRQKVTLKRPHDLTPLIMDLGTLQAWGRAEAFQPAQPPESPAVAPVQEPSSASEMKETDTTPLEEQLTGILTDTFRVQYDTPTGTTLREVHRIDGIKRFVANSDASAFSKKDIYPIPADTPRAAGLLEQLKTHTKDSKQQQYLVGVEEPVDVTPTLQIGWTENGEPHVLTLEFANTTPYQAFLRLWENNPNKKGILQSLDMLSDPESELTEAEVDLSKDEDFSQQTAKAVITLISTQFDKDGRVPFHEGNQKRKDFLTKHFTDFDPQEKEIVCIIERVKQKGVKEKVVRIIGGGYIVQIPGSDKLEFYSFDAKFPPHESGLFLTALLSGGEKAQQALTLVEQRIQTPTIPTFVIDAAEDADDQLKPLGILKKGLKRIKQEVLEKLRAEDTKPPSEIPDAPEPSVAVNVAPPLLVEQPRIEPRREPEVTARTSPSRRARRLLIGPQRDTVIDARIEQEAEALLKGVSPKYPAESDVAATDPQPTS